MSVERASQAERSDSIVFSSFRLDLRAGQLTRAGAPIPLRPKTWAVLVHLAERPGVLVTKEELLDAVWPGIAVTPDTLTKSIGELRLALGDDSSQPTFIATVHRRGFRFIAQLGDAAPAGAEPPEWRAAGTNVRPFVGRTAEMGQLTDRLAAARAGTRQVAFVTGPAGVGKTTLIEAFLDREALHGAIPATWIARGTCIENHGPGEPYMPVLKAIERLAHRPDAAELITLLRRNAPTWLAQMPWLIGEDSEARRQSLQAARAERMMRECAALVEALTRDVTLVLVLEDLHWSDPSTVDLLSHLAEGSEPARLLVIGTYRPAELAVYDHPLGSAVRAMQVRDQCRELAVHELDENGVGAYLDARFPGADFPPTLARRLRTHTDGNPLFLSSVMDHLLARGWILETAPGWSLVPSVDSLDLGLPDDVRRIIDAQLEGLGPADRTLLEAGSVIGLEFSAHGVAALLRCPLEDIEERCEILARPQRFLRFAGSADWPDGSPALHYAFTHELFRRAVYESIPPGRRQRLHQRTGEAFEAAYGDRATDFAAELAAHFEAGRDHLRAIRYLAAAAARSRQRYAGRETIRHLEHAMELAARLPDPAERQRRELDLRLMLAPILSDVRGFASEALCTNCERALALGREIGSTAELFQIVYALAHVYAIRGDGARLPAVTQELEDLADRIGTPAHRLLADSVLARSAMHAGRFADTCRIVEGRFAAMLGGITPEEAASHGADAVAATHFQYALALWFLGHTERAIETMHAASAAALDTAGSPFTCAAALGHSGILAMLCRNPVEVRRLADRLTAFTAEYEIAYWDAVAGSLRGWARVQSGELAAGIVDLESARAALAAGGAQVFSTYILAFLAEAHWRAGDLAAGLAAADAGLRVAETTLDRSYWPELWRLKGELLRASAESGQPVQFAAAEECLLRALTLARESEARSLELRAAVSLARAWQGRSRSAEGRDILGSVCRWFGESAVSPELIEARALVAELSGRASRAPRTRGSQRH